MLIKRLDKKYHRSGFTIVEMLVILPIALILIMVMVYSAVRLTNAAAISGKKTQRIIQLNNALTIIEQDILVSNQFLAKTVLRNSSGYEDTTMLDPNDLSSPQNKNSIHFGIMPTYLNADHPPTNFSSDQPRLILNRLATITNPNSDEKIKKIVHYQTGPFSGANCKYNPPVAINVVYYVSGSSLYRRVIMPYNKSSKSYNADVFCHWNDGGNVKREMPWQQPSCNKTDYNAQGAAKKEYCVTEDQKMIDQVDFHVDYLDNTGNIIDRSIIYDKTKNLKEIQKILDQVRTIKVTIESKIILVKGTVETVVKGEVIATSISDASAYK